MYKWSVELNHGFVIYVRKKRRCHGQDLWDFLRTNTTTSIADHHQWLIDFQDMNNGHCFTHFWVFWVSFNIWCATVSRHFANFNQIKKISAETKREKLRTKWINFFNDCKKFENIEWKITQWFISQC